MSSGEARKPRRKARGNDEAQGTLEGLLGEEAADEDGPEEKPDRARPVKAASGDDPLRASLDALEESVKLLVARHEESVSALAAAEARSRSREGLDPVALEERVKELETETERLERHASFLEDRIRGLLSRVRYVIES
jgi:hypothetical protein